MILVFFATGLRSFVTARPFPYQKIHTITDLEWRVCSEWRQDICSLNRFISKHVPVTCFNSWSNYVRWRIILYYAPLTVRRHPVRSCNGDKSRRRNYGWIWRVPRSRSALLSWLPWQRVKGQPASRDGSSL